MEIEFTKIPVYYINLDREEGKRKQTETMLKASGFINVQRISAIEHPQGRIVGCARSHFEILKTAKPPFIILEDDCALNKEIPVSLEIPDGADALYLGISHWGRYLNHSGPYVHIDKINSDIVRVYNMLAAHAILYISDHYVDICKRIAHHHGYAIHDHQDIGFAEIQKYYNVYCFDEPLFRQYEWSAVTTGRLSDHAYDRNSSVSLFQEVLTNDQNYYKLNETFKSPIKPLLEKRDVNGIPGYYLPTKIL